MIFKIFHTPDAEVIILLLHFSSQNRNTRVFVFFKIFVYPIISSPILDDPINFRSREIVTHGILSAALWAAVPAPESIKADKYPPWVIPAVFKWFSLILDLNWYCVSDIFLSELWEFFKKPIDKNNNFEIVNVANAVYAHAYIINKKAAIAISSFNYPVKTIADNFIIFKLYCGVNLLGINPFILKQDKKKFVSTIPVDNKMNKVFLFRRSFYRLFNKIFRLFGMFNSHK